MNKNLKHIKIIENPYKHKINNKEDIIHYDSGLSQYTYEEVDIENQKYYASEAACIEEILQDGFIEFPILYDNGPEPIWSSCYLPPEFIPSCSEGFEERFGLRYNIYIPSYKRSTTSKTDKLLDKFGIENYYMCIDPSQYKDYKKTFPRKRIIIRDPSFKNESKLDLASSAIVPDYYHGASGVFNALLYISKSLGEKAYFTMDDDILGLGLKARKGHIPAIPGEKYDKDNYYRASNIDPNEVDFSLKELLNDMMILFDKMRNKSFYSLEKYGLVFSLPISHKLGTRSYSFYLTDNSVQCDHLANQNNDIVTSLEMSKYGYVNVIFEGFQYNSEDTQSDSGGNSGAYKKLGTLDKGKVLCQAQPNYSKISILYSRVHHTVDFNSYNKMRLLGAIKEEK